MVAIIPVDKPEDSNLGENAAAERGKAVKLAKGGAFQLQTFLISALSQHPCVYRPAVTILFRSKPLSLPKKLYRHENSNQFPFIFAATFNGVIRRKLKSLADTNVVIIAHFSQNYQSV